MKYLPLDVSSFSVIRTGNYIYVDKTEHIYNLFKPGESRYYFLSRPRRFGKSLLVATLKELFLGNRKLFENLWIHSSDYEWKEHSVIHLDFSAFAHRTPQELIQSLVLHLDQIAKTYGVDISEAELANDKLTTLIKKLSIKNKVVVLIDEYDKPILNHINNPALAESIRAAMGDFYGALKAMDDYLRAIFVTGVTKFSKTSIFSGMNNLNDISIKPEAAELLGYTYEEINHSFKEYLPLVNPEATVHKTLADMKQWYNGYRFSDKDVKVYNPFSVLYYLKNKKLLNYWFESGTPSFLIDLLKAQYQSLEDLQDQELSYDSLGYFQINKIPLVPLLFQTGYLTITDYDKASLKFIVGFPNLEVENSFNKYLITVLADNTSIAVDDARSKIIRALKNKDLQRFCSIVQSLFANIPYTLHIKKESYYHSLFQFFLSFISLEAQSDVLTNRGRIDTTLTIDNYVYIFELKLNAKPSQALAQIHEKKYYERFLTSGKQILLVGLDFDIKSNELKIEYISKELPLFTA